MELEWVRPGYEMFLVNPTLFLISADGRPLRGFIVSYCSPKSNPEGYRGLCLREFAVSGRKGDYREGEFLHPFDTWSRPGMTLLLQFRTPWLKEVLGVQDLGFDF